MASKLKKPNIQSETGSGEIMTAVVATLVVAIGAAGIGMAISDNKDKKVAAKIERAIEGHRKVSILDGGDAVITLVGGDKRIIRNPILSGSRVIEQRPDQKSTALHLVANGPTGSYDGRTITDVSYNFEGHILTVDQAKANLTQEYVQPNPTGTLVVSPDQANAGEAVAVHEK